MAILGNTTITNLNVLGDLKKNGTNVSLEGHTHSYAASTHNQASNTINAMTGYSKASAAAAIAATDSLNTAIGKLEKALDGKQASGTYLTSVTAHNQASNTINAMTGYSKPSSTSAIATTDTLNAAIGKLEKALDGKQASGSYLTSVTAHNQASNTITAMTGYSKATTAAAIATTDSLNAAIGKLEKALDGKQASGNYLTGITKAQVTTALGYTPPTSDTNTTYSAGTGLSLSGTTFNHSNSITAASSGLYKISVDAQGHITGTTAVAKADITGLGIPASDTNTTYSAAANGGLTLSGTAFSADGNQIINNLSAGTSAAQRTDYIVAQYAGGGTTTTTYHRRTLANIFAALNKSDITTALGYTPPTSDTNTTYSAASGGGLTLSGTAFSITDSGVTAGSYGPSANATPAHSGTFSVPYITVDAKGKVTAASTKTITLPASGNTDTKNTAGSTDTSSKIFLIGATSQAANPQTYSHDTAYVGTDGCLYSNGTKVSVEGHTHSYAASSHTHNYAGSSSAGGAATSAIKLDGNDTMTYGWTGLNYFNKSMTAGCVAKANDSPTTAWWHILRFNHSNATGYYTDLAVPFNSDSLYWKCVRGGTLAKTEWVKVLDTDNYKTTVTPANIGAAAASHTHNYAAASHNQASNTINAMTGYSKATTASAIATTDSLNTAIGKLEKALDSVGSTKLKKW